MQAMNDIFDIFVITELVYHKGFDKTKVWMIASNKVP